MPLPLNNQKNAFTLIEVLIVVAIVALLAISSASGFINYSGDYKFLSVYENVIAQLRHARLLAINNSQVQNSVPVRYGALVDSDYIRIFADNGGTDFRYDPSGSPNPDQDIKLYDFSSTGIQLLALDSTQAHNPLGEPVVVYYEPVSGETNVLNNSNVVLSKTSDPYVVFRICSAGCTVSDREKFILLFQISGLAEEFDSLNFNYL